MKTIFSVCISKFSSISSFSWLLYLHVILNDPKLVQSENVKPIKKSVDNQNRKVGIIITGGAGFIGYHLNKYLAIRNSMQTSHPTYEITSTDNFNNFYTPAALKYQRAANLWQNHGIKVQKVDVCDEDNMKGLFSKSSNISFIIHLAMHAGVRSAVIEPDEYMRNNVNCFSVLLKLLKSQSNTPKLIYASSSSVYSRTYMKQGGYTERDTITLGKLPNAYARSKLLTELMADKYSNELKSKLTAAIGLRFFTVYGPWGRPDMALYGFSNSILHNKTITMYVSGTNNRFYKSKTTPHLRDYTFVDDVVSGIVSVLDLSNKRVALPRMINLGNNHSHSTFQLLQLIEKNLATISKLKPHVQRIVSNVEAEKTHANILLAKQFLKYSPKTKLKSGAEAFFKWFYDYESKLMPCASECTPISSKLCFPSPWDQAAEISRRITRGCKVVIYTAAISTFADSLHALNSSWRFFDGKLQPATCAIAFVSAGSVLAKSVVPSSSRSNHSQGDNGWVYVAVDSDFSGFSNNSSRKASRVPKISPGLFFDRSVEYAVWTDAKLRVLLDPLELVTHTMHSSNTSIALMRKPKADTIETIAKFNIREQLNGNRQGRITNDIDLYINQYTAYQEEQRLRHFYFTNNFDGQLIVHRLSKPEFRCAWYREYQMWGDRDQNSANYLIAKHASQCGGNTSYLEYLPFICEKTASQSVRLIDSETWQNKWIVMERLPWSYQ